MVSFLIVLFGLTMLLAASTSRIEAYIKLLSGQGFILFFLVLAEAAKMDHGSLVFLGVETLGFKALVIPGFLLWLVRRNGMRRDLEPHIPTFHSLLVVTCIFLLGFLVPTWTAETSRQSAVNPIYFGVSVSTILTGLFVILTRRRIVTHVLGYMMIENGVFLLSLSAAKEMPFVVNLGVFLDVFIAIFVLGLFASKIQHVFAETHVESLTDLKD